ncbi:MAG: hypothetical protein HKN08_04660, partial [Gammaproteobacteria bacterium]|nr:hypothetical protein [Gammaproteobacteria bacterium]
MTTQAVEHFLSQAANLSGLKDIHWLEDQRRAAMASLTATGFPTRKVEDWKYTDISPILKKNFSLATSDDTEDIQSSLASAQMNTLDCYQLVFINGRFSASHSSLNDLPENVDIASLNETLKDQTIDLSSYLNREDEYKDGFVALNMSLMEDGAVIQVGKNVELDKPVNLVFISTGKDQPAQNIRNIIIAGANSRIEVIETYTGPSTSEYFTNTVTEAWLEDGAGLNH